MKPSIIFAIDKSANIMATALMHQLGAKPLIGRYRMRLEDEEYDTFVEEQSWLLPLDVFEDKVLGTDMLSEQESVLQVSGCNKQYAHLRMLDTYRTHDTGVVSMYLGCLKAVSEKAAREAGEWSYDIMNDRWFITVTNSQSEAPAERDARELWAAVDAMVRAVEEDRWAAINTAANVLTEIRDKQKPKWLDAEQHTIGETV